LIRPLLNSWRTVPTSMLTRQSTTRDEVALDDVHAVQPDRSQRSGGG
jgi:hypothetical protein